MTSHGYKQNEISLELSMGTKILQNKLRFKSIFVEENKNLDHSAYLNIR
jgi:hypothetical protein